MATLLEGKWKFSTEDQDQPDLGFADDKGTIFDVGCGGRVTLWAAHPSASKKQQDLLTTTSVGGEGAWMRKLQKD